MSSIIAENIEISSHIPLTNIVLITDNYESFKQIEKTRTMFCIYIPKEIILYGNKIHELRLASDLLYKISHYCDICLIISDDIDYYYSIASNVTCEVNFVTKRDILSQKTNNKNISICHV